MALSTLRLARLMIAGGTCLIVAGCGETPTTTTHITPGPDSLSFAIGFSTYLGGDGTESARDVAIDAQGNIYVAGETKSANFPATPGAFQVSFHSTGALLSDAFVAKYDSNGNLLWATFLGGPEYDRAYALEVDEQGYVYVAGRAGAGFPVTPGALQTTFAGGTQPDGAYGPQDGFVCKIKSDGSGVVFCTYIGTSDYAPIRDIAVDANHDIYLATSATSADPFPAAWFTNAYQKTIRGGRDGAVVKLRGDGSGVEWATYLGGSGEEANGNTVRVTAGGVYVVNTTHSPDMPTANGFDHSLGGIADMYLARLSLDGSQLIYGTYLGGSGNEVSETHHVGIDSAGNAVVALGSDSPDFPTPTNAFQPAYAGSEEVLVLKVAPSGALVGATYLGGSGYDFPEGVMIDPAGNIYLSGSTTSANFPTTGGAGPAGGTDVVIVALSPDLSHLLFSRRLGGSGEDAGRAIALRSSALVVIGQNDSPNWPTSAAAQASRGGGLDGMVVKFIKQ